MRLDGLVRQVAGGDDVGQRRAVPAAGAPAVGQVDFNKAAVFAAQAAKGIQRLDDARAFGPTAARAAGKRNHGHHSRCQRLLADFMVFRRRPRRWRQRDRRRRRQ